MRLLLVEDDPRVAESLAIALERCGHSVHVSGTMAAALDALRSLEVDAVISDGSFPAHGNEEIFAWGPELTDMARKAGLKAILVSGNDDLVHAERGKGGTALVKPVRAEQILDALENDDG